MKTIDFNFIVRYLNQNYRVLENKFTDVYANVEYGQDIVLECYTVFDYDILDCERVLKQWAFANGLDEENFGKAYKRPIYFSTELAQDLQGFYGLDVIAEVERQLVQEIAHEIDRQIINDLMQINGNENFTPYRED
jgi:hypothetical protein